MIYFLEDEANIRNFVIYAINNSGLEAEGFDHPDEFWKAMKINTPELILLDIMLPGEDGLSILKKLRINDSTRKIPVIMLTAKGTEYDKVIGLDNGADDYVTKPFGTLELISRIKALLRRTAEYDEVKEYRAGELYLCPSRHIISVNGEEITLTLKEFELLHLLFRNRGCVMTRDDILTNVWGYEFDGENRTVDVHIRTLRSKLGTAGKYIETVRGIGYKIGGNNDK